MRAHPLDDEATGRQGFMLRRLHALSGVAPVGVFLVMHLATNHRAVEGRAAFDGAVGEIQSVPLLPAVEALGVLAPLAFHALYGVVIALEARPNVGRYPSTRNWLFVIQRVTGFVAFGFVLLHLGQFRVAKALGALSPDGFYARLGALLSEPAMFAVYMLGLTASVVHFANGLWQSGTTWGFAASAGAQRRMAGAAWVLGLGLWLAGVDTLVHFFARCGGLFASSSAQRDAVCQGADMTEGLSNQGRPVISSRAAPHIEGPARGGRPSPRGPDHSR